jgi:hypothetical protein
MMRDTAHFLIRLYINSYSRIRMLWLISYIPKTHETLLRLLHTIFNPTMIGSMIAVIYIIAWIRMENISELKRTSTNSKLMEKSGNDEYLSLEEYSLESHGELFGLWMFSNI